MPQASMRPTPWSHDLLQARAYLTSLLQQLLLSLLDQSTSSSFQHKGLEDQHAKLDKRAADYRTLVLVQLPSKNWSCGRGKKVIWCGR